MKEEIAGGLRNAVERGTIIEQAIKSFVSAGYSEKEVLDAAQEFSPSTQILQIQPVRQQDKIALPLPKNNYETQQATASFLPPPSTGKANKILIIILVIFLLALIGGLAMVLLYPDKIVQLLQGP